ncbi:MAG: hypothetical protein ACI4QZ_01150 [Eubacteriales bacterium]
MKRIFLLFFVIALAAGLVSCGSKNENEEKKKDAVVTVRFMSDTTDAVQTLEEADAKFIAELVYSEGWTDETSECDFDVEFMLGEDMVKYRSECGTFSDYSGGKSMILDDELRNAVNDVLGNYRTSETGVTDEQALTFSAP